MDQIVSNKVIQKYLGKNDDKNTSNKNLQDAAKAEIRGNCVT